MMRTDMTDDGTLYGVLIAAIPGLQAARRYKITAICEHKNRERSRGIQN